MRTKIRLMLGIRVRLFSVSSWQLLQGRNQKCIGGVLSRSFTPFPFLAPPFLPLSPLSAASKWPLKSS